MNFHPLVIFAAASDYPASDPAFDAVMLIVFSLSFIGIGAFLTRKLWMPFLKKKFPEHFPEQSQTQTGSSPQHTGKKCAACGAINDDFLANCKFCNAPLAVAASQENSNEALLEDLNEMMAVLENRKRFGFALKCTIQSDSRLGKKFSQGGMNDLMRAWSGQVVVDFKTVRAECQKTLGTLKIRALSNPTLAALVNEFSAKLENMK
jgi:hypothetical protein